MATKINIKRPGTGLIKLEITHNGTRDIRTNLRSALLGTTGEKQKHILEIRELFASLSHSALTENPTQILFKIFGRHDGNDIRLADGSFNDDDHHLGERPAAGGSTSNTGVEFIPENEFSFYVPVVHSIRDLLWKIQQKISRINMILVANGWRTDLGITNNVVGQLEGGVGTPTHGVNTIVLPSEAIEEQNMPDPPIVAFHYTPTSQIEFSGTAAFWNSFGIWCSPYFRKLTGFPELLVRSNNVFGEAASTDVGLNAGQFIQPDSNTNAEPVSIRCSNNLLITCEERESILITSDIPTEPERNCTNGIPEVRFVLAHFDVKAQHEHITGSNYVSYKRHPEWYIEGKNVVGNLQMDSPKQTGFAALVLPTSLPSINIRALLRRQQFDFTTNEYKLVEVPLLQHDIDQIILRMNFTLQL